MNAAQFTAALDAIADPSAAGEIIAAQRATIVELRAATGKLPPALITKVLRYAARQHDIDLSYHACLTDDEIEALRNATFSSLTATPSQGPGLEVEAPRSPSAATSEARVGPSAVNREGDRQEPHTGP